MSVPGSLKDRPDELSRGYDRESAGIRVPDDLSGLAATPHLDDENLPKGHPDRADTALGANALKNKEADGEAPTGGAALPGEGESQFFYAGKGLAQAMSDSAVPLSATQRVLTVLRTRKGAAGAGGGALAIGLLIFFGITTASLEAINIREQFTGRGSASQSFSMKHRRGTAFANIVKQFIKEKPTSVLADAERINQKAFTNSLAKNGFEVAIDNTTGKITSISKDLSDGTKATINYAAENIDKEIASALERGGAEYASSLDKVISSSVARWKGPFARTFYQGKLGSRLNNWVGEKKVDPNKTDAENSNELIADAQKPDAEVPEQKGLFAGEEDPNTPPDKEGNPTNQVTDPAAAASGETAGDLAAPLDDIETGLIETGARTAEQEAATLEKAALSATGAGLKSGLLSTIDYSQWDQVTCKAVGTLNYIATIRNVLLKVELARFALKYLNAADSQKAGLITSEGLKLFFQYWHSGSSTKGSYTGAAGLGYSLGDHTRQVSQSSRTQFSSGRENAGAFAVISDFIQQIPGVNSDGFRTNCKLVNNTWFQIGSITLGVVVAIFTLGGSVPISLEAQSFWLAGAQAAIQLTLEIGGPILARTGKHYVFTELKDQLSKGDGLGAAFGAFQQMNGSANSLQLATKEQSTALHAAAMDDYNKSLRSQSLFARYLSPTNGYSLVSRMALARPPNATSAVNSVASVGTSVLNPFKFADSILHFSGDAYADTDTQCGDPVASQYASDPFCSSEISVAPEINIDETYQKLLSAGYIDAAGNPTDYKAGDGKSFKDWVLRCGSGEPTVFYNTKIKTDGTSEVNITDCTDNTVLAGEKNTTDKAYAYIYNAQPQPSFFAKLMGARAYAAPAGQLMTRREYFAGWQAYIVDTKSIVEEMTNTYDGDAEQPVQAPDNGDGGISTPNAEAGVDIPGQNTDQLSCPASPTIVDEGVNPIGQAYLNKVPYDIRLCAVHGVHLNAIDAKNFDNLFTAMIAAGYKMNGTYGFRDMASQIKGYDGGKGKDTYAPPGTSNHQFGTAADITCANADGSNKYTAGTGRGQASFLTGVSRYPCLDWVHKNSANYGLLLQCDGKGSAGEIRANSGGCEWWHLSPTGK